MKSNLTLALIGCAALTCAAQQTEGVKLETTPAIIPNALVQTLSPDGRYGVSVDYGFMIIFDFQTGKTWQYIPNETLNEDYFVGVGNPFSANDILVGGTSFNGDACYWENGKWYKLPVLDDTKTNLSKGINSDGSMICGGLGISDDMMDETKVMSVPVVWRRNPDGSYGNPEILPYPEKDFTGRTPNYVTALTVSDDGKTVLGQVYDYSGMAVAPIIYTCDDSGKWSYDYLGEELCNPNHVVYPEWPAEIGNPPEPENYMSGENKENYIVDMKDWASGGYDPDAMPDFEDYMSQEELAAYNKALAEYNTALEAYNAKVMNFLMVFSEQMTNLKTRVFLFNNQYMTPDASMFASTRVITVEDPTSETGVKTIDQPCLFVKGADGKYQILDLERGYQVSQLASDGSVLAYNMDSGAQRAFIAPKATENTKFQPLEDYIATLNAPLGQWLRETWTHELTDLTGDSQNVVLSGIATCTPDMKLFSTVMLNYWDMSETAPYEYSYVFGPDMAASVKGVAAEDAAAVRVLDGGVLEVNGTTDLRVYSADGALVFSAQDASGRVSTGLPAGIYIVRTADTSLKVRF